MSKPRIETFEEFWPFYVGEHSLFSTRVFHVTGTTLAIATLILAVAMQWWWLLVAVPVVGYGLAWISHFGIEKNRPASFKYPWWSLLADLKLWALAMTGRMEAEVRRVLGAGANS